MLARFIPNRIAFGFDTRCGIHITKALRQQIDQLRINGVNACPHVNHVRATLGIFGAISAAHGSAFTVGRA
jgi:hypothetical protein